MPPRYLRPGIEAVICRQGCASHRRFFAILLGGERGALVLMDDRNERWYCLVTFRENVWCVVNGNCSRCEDSSWLPWQIDFVSCSVWVPAQHAHFTVQILYTLRSMSGGWPAAPGDWMRPSQCRLWSPGDLQPPFLLCPFLPVQAEAQKHTQKPEAHLGLARLVALLVNRVGCDQENQTQSNQLSRNRILDFLSSFLPTYSLPLTLPPFTHIRSFFCFLELLHRCLQLP